MVLCKKKKRLMISHYLEQIFHNKTDNCIDLTQICSKGRILLKSCISHKKRKISSPPHRKFCCLYLLCIIVVSSATPVFQRDQCCLWPPKGCSYLIYFRAVIRNIQGFKSPCCALTKVQYCRQILPTVWSSILMELRVD